MDTVKYWKDLAESKLPHKKHVQERNREITAQYATLYLLNPMLFKWAGMAAFASNKVGIALMPLNLNDYNTKTVKQLTDESIHLNLIDDLNLIRRINNKVYEDIIWAHLVFNSDKGGIKLLKSLITDKNSLIIKGFTLLDASREALRKGNKVLANNLAWEGNYFLLKHEQLNTINPLLQYLKKSFTILLSVFTTMDFDAKNFNIDFNTHTSFYFFMWTKGLGVLLKTTKFPSFELFNHRWFWIEKRMLKIWIKVNKEDTELVQKLNLLKNKHLI